MEHRELKNLLPAYALGCADEIEAEILSNHLSTCGECRMELAAYQRTADLLAFGAPGIRPPDDLKDEVLKTIHLKDGKRFKLASACTHQPQKSFWSKFSPGWAFAGVTIIFFLAIGNIVQLYSFHSLKVGEINQEMVILKMQGTTNAPKADGTLVVGLNPKEGVLVVSDLPVPIRGSEYQLWLMKNGLAANGGVFSVTPNGYAVVKVVSSESLLAIDSFRITLEPIGGSPNPTGRQFMVANL